MFPDICETPKHSNNLLYLLLTTSGLRLGPASRSYGKKTESAAAPRAVPDSLALGYARLLIVEERQLAQSLAVAHDLAAHLVATPAQEPVRRVRVYTSLDTMPFGMCRPRSHRDGRRRVACYPVPLSARGLFSPRVCQRLLHHHGAGGN